METSTVVLHRIHYNDKETIGYLEHDGMFLCYTLEPSKENKKHPCIPLGTFYIQNDYPSSKFGLCPALLKVPYRTGILIHYGNKASQSLGCILVGDELAKLPSCHGIFHSRDTFQMVRRYFNKFIDSIKVIDDIQPLDKYVL